WSVELFSAALRGAFRGRPRALQCPCFISPRRTKGLVMIDPVRQEVIALAHTVVVKVGTSVLAGPDGRLDLEQTQSLADQLHRMTTAGKKVALVSSGAIGAGIGRLGLSARPTDLRR